MKGEYYVRALWFGSVGGRAAWASGEEVRGVGSLA